MFDEARQLFDQVKTATPEQKSLFTSWFIITLIRDLAYYTVTGVVAWALGRRLIHAITTAIRESKRVA